VLTKISLQVGWICFSACGMMAWHFVYTLWRCDSFFKANFKKSFGCLVGVLHLFVFRVGAIHVNSGYYFIFQLLLEPSEWIFQVCQKKKGRGWLKEIIQKTSQAHTTSPLVYCLLHIWPHSNCFPFCHVGHAFSVWLSENPLNLSSSR